MTLFCGPCLFTDMSESQMIIDTAMACKEIGVDVFRCKLWGGGTRPEKYFPGVGEKGIKVLADCGMPSATEVHTSNHFYKSFLSVNIPWIGARNSSNYTLRRCLSNSGRPWALKRGANMSIENLIGAYDVDHPTWIIERGVDALYQPDGAPFMPDLKGMIRLKYERPDIFETIVVDCSHSVFIKHCIADTYRAFKAIGVNNFMFECTIDGKSKTDQGHMLSVKELESILKEG